MRINRFLAQAGVASRRRAEDLIVAGKVTINGRIVRDLATGVGAADQVCVEGRPVAAAHSHTYLVLNKPPGYVTTMSDPQGRHTIAELIPADAPRVVPVGRLDYATSGLLLLTNDGDLAHRLTHPRFGVEKTYRVLLRGHLTPAAIDAIRSGIDIGDPGPTGPAKLRVVRSSRDRTEIDMTIHEGRNRQIRRMCEAVGLEVEQLTRTRFGSVALGDLPVGRSRALSERELGALRRESTPDDER